MIIIYGLLYSQLFFLRLSKILAKNLIKIWCSAKNQDYEVARSKPIFFAVDSNYSEDYSQIELKYNLDSIIN